MKTTFRSTTLQAIMRTALLFTVLLSFPATIMAYEETLDNGVDKFKYFLSGEVVNEGELWSSGIKRSDMVFNQNINIPIHIKAEKISGKSKKFSINVQTYFFTNGKEKKGPSFSVDTGKFEERIDIPKGTTRVRVYINYLGHFLKYIDNKEYEVCSEFNVEAEYEVTGTIVEETAPQPWSTEEVKGKCRQEDSKIRFNDFYGEVKIRCNFEEDDSYEFVDTETVIYEDDRIKTEEDSEAILGLWDMSTYWIKPESILIIHTEEDKTSRLELIVGAIVGNWKKMLRGESVKCEMSQCVAGISGTIVAFEETGKLDLIVFVLFLIPGLPKDVFTYVVPLTDMDFKKFIGLTTLGRIPGVVASTYTAAGIADGNIVGPVIVASVVAIIAIVAVLFRDKIMDFFGRG